jgi:folate/biopterin transporter
MGLFPIACRSLVIAAALIWCFFNLLGALSWVFMAQAVNTPTMALGTILVGTLSMAFSDVIIDALVVQRARAESQGDAGSLQAFTWGCMSVGAIASAYFSGSLVEDFGTRTVFMIAAILPVLDALAAFAISDHKISFAQISEELLKNASELEQFTESQEPQSHLVAQPQQLAAAVSQVSKQGDRPKLSLPQLALQNIRQQVKQLWQAISSRSIFLPTLFIFLWQATPSADSALFYFITNDLHFNPEFLGRVRLVTSVASLLGVWVFQRYLRDVPMRRIFLWTTIAATLLGLTSLLLVTHTNRLIGIEDHWFSLGDSLILTVAGRIAFMPLLVLAARLCPVGIEATLFALLMSVFNLAGLCSYQLGAGLTYWLGITETNFTNLWLLVTITNLTTLLPLPFLNWLPDDRAITTQSDQSGDLSDRDRQESKLLSPASNGKAKLDMLTPQPVAIVNNDSN